MIARIPKYLKAGGKTNHVSSFWDIFNTFAEMADIDMSQKIDGISLLPLVNGKTENQKKHDHLYWEFHEENGKQAVRMGDWKGVRLNVFDNPNAPIELYDLYKDLKDMNNLVDKNPEIIAEIEESMKSSHTFNPDFPFKSKREI